MKVTATTDFITINDLVSHKNIVRSSAISTSILY